MTKEIVKALIKTNKKEFNYELKENDLGEKILIIETREKAENNKANKEIERELSKRMKKKIKIIKGLKNKNKLLLIE